MIAQRANRRGRSDNRDRSSENPVDDVLDLLSEGLSGPSANSSMTLEVIKMTRMLLPLAAALLVAVPSVQAQEAVFVIRHAEKAGSGDDPDLTAAGRARAVRD